jgi:hypothetical protein
MPTEEGNQQWTSLPQPTFEPGTTIRLSWLLSDAVSIEATSNMDGVGEHGHFVK